MIVSDSVDPREIAHFAAMAEEWWDAEGKFKPLHRLNPVRLQYIRDQITRHAGRQAAEDRPLAGLAILDIGCGGGLVAEPLARLGASVTAIDASAENIAIATSHAETMGLHIDYRHTSAEELAAAGARFDTVLALEIIEHVADVDSFIGACGTLVKTGGLFIGSTLNRTPKSFLLSIVGAEYILRWLPRGTHNWRKFVTPAEFSGALRRAGLDTLSLAGMHYSPLNDRWSMSASLDVNYLVTAQREAA